MQSPKTPNLTVKAQTTGPALPPYNRTVLPLLPPSASQSASQPTNCPLSQRTDGRLAYHNANRYVQTEEGHTHRPTESPDHHPGHLNFALGIGEAHAVLLPVRQRRGQQAAAVDLSWCTAVGGGGTGQWCVRGWMDGSTSLIIQTDAAMRDDE